MRAIDILLIVCYYINNKPPLGHIMKCVVHVLFAVLVLFSSNVMAQQSFESMPSIEQFEEGPQIYYSGQYTILTQPECGASACFYTITVYNSATNQRVIQLINTNPTVRALAENCWELPDTDDFAGMLGVPRALGPSIPLAFCFDDRSIFVTDMTDKMLRCKIFSRRDELLSQTKTCRASKSCTYSPEDEAKIVELAVYQEIMERFHIHFDLPRNWLGGMHPDDYEELQSNIKELYMRRLEHHLP